MDTPVLTRIFRTQKVYENEERPIYELVRNQKLSASLEIGCAYGISSLYIRDALPLPSKDRSVAPDIPASPQSTLLEIHRPSPYIGETTPRLRSNKATLCWHISEVSRRLI